jgi:hypothetical protein
VHIAEVEEIQADIDEGTVAFEENSFNNEFAALSLNNSNDIHFSSYVLSGISEVPHEPLLALSSVPQLYNTALDSACTNHIFRDRDIFHTYDTNGAVPVKTANCGVLTTLAIGDIKIRLKIKDRVIVWTLRYCLHAPDMPINLVSVGALQERHMSLTFSF